MKLSTGSKKPKIFRLSGPYRKRLLTSELDKYYNSLTERFEHFDREERDDEYRKMQYTLFCCNKMRYIKEKMCLGL